MAQYQFNASTKQAPSGYGSREQFTLYVNNLPEELNEIGLQQVFNHYGELLGHFYRRNTNWAYITYGSYLEAENAIKDLHNKPPLYLSVSLAKERVPKGIQFPKAPTDENITKRNENYIERNIKLTEDSCIQSKVHCKPLDILKNVESNSKLPENYYTSNDDLLYPYPYDQYTYNPYQNMEPYMSTNALWTRGQLTVTQDGKRHVSLGRGYTKYEIPDSNPEIQKHISKVYEKRTFGVYEYGKDTLQNGIGKCQKCLKLTKYTCELCAGFYCSKACQVEDWPRHKIECQAIPALVERWKSLSTSQLSNEEQIYSRTASTTQVPLRRPKKLVDATTPSQYHSNTMSKDQDEYNASPSISSDSINRNHALKIANLRNLCQETEKPIRNTVNTVNSSKLEFESKHNIHPKKIEERNNLELSNITKIEEDISFSKPTFLSKYKFTAVIIIIQEDSDYWVQKVEDVDKLAELMNDLQIDAEKAQKVSPVVGNMYAVQYESLWHRAIVTCLHPLKVHYIDYGNTEVVENGVREIGQCKNVPKFAAKIRLPEKEREKYKNLKPGDVIKVVMTSVDANEVINVRVHQADSPSNPRDTDNLKADQAFSVLKTSATNTSESPLMKLENIVNTVCIEEEGVLEIHAELSNDTYSITLLPNSATTAFKEILLDLPQMCEQIAQNSNHRPRVGELICGKRLDGDWLRGYVLVLEPLLKMAIIDEARVMVINKTVPCPQKYMKISTFGATCKIIGATNKFKGTEQCPFKVLAHKTNKDQDEIEIEISKDENKWKAIVRPWTPMPEQKGTHYAELTSGSEVCLTSYRNQYTVFVRSLQPAECERYTNIMQAVAKCAQIASFLEESPAVGQMVIAQYSDDNYYRAIVTNVNNEQVTISYVDFGNNEVTSIKKLKVLSNDLKELPACVTKVILKDVPQDVPMTVEVNQYLSYIVGTEAAVTCTFDSIPSKDGVSLKLASGEIINEKIRKLLIPTWSKPLEDTTCYMMQDLGTVSLGNVGDVVLAVILHSFGNGYKYSMCRMDHDLITHVAETMSPLMAEYAEKSSFYIPRDNELCIALYENDWYRACCNCRNETAKTSSVVFVDFGNLESVSHKDIRSMPKDFLTPHALANICTIVNLAPTDSSGCFSPKLQMRLSELLVSHTLVEIKIVKFDEESGVYSVELPVIRQQLITELLISP